MPPLEDDGEEMTAQMQKLDARVVAALERRPRVEIPEGFAARVAQQALTMRVHVPVRVPQFGTAAVVVGAGVSAAAMLLLAPRTAGHDPFWMAMQWLLCAQFCALTVWLGASRQEGE